MYFEGGDIAYANFTTGIWPYFGARFISAGQGMAAGNVERLTGQEGTFARGMRPTYLYRQWPDNYVDELETEGATLFLRDQSGIGRAMYHDGGRYRTIVSSVSFSAFGETYRDSLMAAYLRYLTSVPGVGERGRDQVLGPGLRVTPSVARSGQTVKLHPGTGTAGLERVEVIDASGRTIADLVVSNGGATWDMLDRDGIVVPAGTYFLRASGAGGGATSTFVVLR